MMPFPGFSVLLLGLVLIRETFGALKPVILVPGLGGSQLEAKLNKARSDYFFCYRHSNWYSIWVSLLQLEIEYCMVENMRLTINATDGRTSNCPGVDIRVPGFGSTETIEVLDPFHPIELNSIQYYRQMAERLVDMGYVRGLSLRGAPYDFRKAPNEMKGYLEDLGKLIEDSYKINNNSRVVLVGHSMGNNYILYFLNGKSPAWKDKYIAGYISMAAPWAGSVKSLRFIASGDSVGIPRVIFNPLTARSLQQSFASTAWMMPSKPQWKHGDVLVKSPKRNYTVDDYDDFFRDVNFELGIVLKKSTESLLKATNHPGVRTFCLYGLVDPFETPKRFIYTKRSAKWYDEQPIPIYGPGDGTVNKRSLEVCKDWPNTSVKEFHGIHHIEILKHKDVLDYVEDILRQL